MMRLDLSAARSKWLAESGTDEERANREASDFLTYCDEKGRFADFHANRHTFISRLGRSGVSLMTAQKLARHSDPKLTSNVYDHLERDEKAAAIGTLQGPPVASGQRKAEVSVAHIVAQTPVVLGQGVSSSGNDAKDKRSAASGRNPLSDGDFVPLCQLLSADDQVRLLGLEPRTYGLKVRCSTD